MDLTRWLLLPPQGARGKAHLTFADPAHRLHGLSLCGAAGGLPVPIVAPPARLCNKCRVQSDGIERAFPADAPPTNETRHAYQPKRPERGKPTAPPWAYLEAVCVSGRFARQAKTHLTPADPHATLHGLALCRVYHKPMKLVDKPSNSLICQSCRYTAARYERKDSHAPGS